MKRSSPLSVMLLVSIASSVVTGCRSVPQTHYYDLHDLLSSNLGPEANRVAAHQELATTGLTIGVEPFSVDPPYDQDRLVYRIGSASAEVCFYRTHRWASPIGRLLALEFARGLSDTPSLALFEPAAVGVEYATVLTGRVFHIEEVDIADGQLVRARLEVLLVRDRQPIWSKSLTSETKIRVESVPEIVEQLRHDIGGLISETKSGLAELLTSIQAQESPEPSSHCRTTTPRPMPGFEWTRCPFDPLRGG